MMILVLGAYDGWIEVTYVGSELRDPGRNMPLSILFSTLLVGLLYVGVSVAMLYVLGQEATAKSSMVAADAMRVVLGPAGGALIAAAVMLSTLGCSNGIVFTAARIPYAMALRGDFFAWAGRLNTRYRTPNTALVAGLLGRSAALRHLQPARGAWSCLVCLLRCPPPRSWCCGARAGARAAHRVEAIRSPRWCSSSFRGISWEYHPGNRRTPRSVRRYCLVCPVCGTAGEVRERAQ
jgi:L-asparagine transporter-like permease